MVEANRVDAAPQSRRIALHYEVRGAGAPIVLLHGFTSSFARNWEERSWVKFLTDNDFQVIGFDFRSHGRSTPAHTAAEVATDALAGDVVRLLDHLEVERAHMFGFSMGGGVALTLAMNYPERINRIAIAGVGDAAINRLHDPEQIREIAAAFERRPDEPLRTEDAERIRRGAEKEGNDVAALAPFLHTGGWPGGLAVQREISAPVLIIAAGNDQYMGQIDALSSWLPNAEVHRVAGADHYTLLDDERVREAVLRFLLDRERGG